MIKVDNENRPTAHRSDFSEVCWASVSELIALRLTTCWLTIAMVVAKKYVLIKAFDGFPSDENIELQEETLAPLKDGGRKVCPSDPIWRSSWNKLFYRYGHSGGCLNIKMSSYQYRNPHVKEKTVLRPSYLKHGNPHTWERRSLYIEMGPSSHDSLIWISPYLERRSLHWNWTRILAGRTLARYLNSPASRLFVQPMVQPDIKRNIKAPHH